ncbi:hypothetical protein BD408DRAFT_413429 [Parasitella parasitica]|nr:hypothetical protein BD408DRAFT_413429 [Parasitella parasitica]
MLEPVKPREKVVVQGDSFISKILDAPLQHSRDIIGNAQVKSIFDRYLGLDKKDFTAARYFQEISDLFFEQMVDDLKSYKANQPPYLRDEITEDDIILLMKRQKIITDKQSIEATIHKYLPKEYADLACQSALANNHLYPTNEELDALDYGRFKDNDDDNDDNDIDDDFDDNDEEWLP